MTDDLGPVLGVVMAGGLSRRMGGGDKCEIVLGEKTLLQRVIERAEHQVEKLIINANGDLTRFQKHQLPVVADCVKDYAGPLAGILTGMAWARESMPECRWICSFASDTPFFPMDLVDRLSEGVHSENAVIACAKSGEQLHPVFGLWPVQLYDDLYQTLVVDDIRRVGAWIKRHHLAEVCYEQSEIMDPFLNINTPEDLELAKALASNKTLLI